MAKRAVRAAGPEREGPGRPAVLSRERILDAARELGHEQLSMPAVAEALGVSTPALYRYFPSREKLVEALAESVIGEIPLPPDRGQGWQAWVRETALATRAVLVRHPVLAQRIRAGAFAPAALRIMDRAIGVLTSDGFRDADAVRVYQLVTHYVYRSAAADARRGRQRRTFAPELIRTVEDLGADELPHLARVVGEHARLDADEVFERNLDDLLAGIEAGQRSRTGA